MATDATDSSSSLLYEIQGQHEQDGIFYLPSTPKAHLESIKEYELSSQDLIVSTFSKSGTTWTQEVAYLIHNGADVEEAKSRPIMQRVPFIDYIGNWPLVTALESPKLIKTHLRPEYFHQKIMDAKVKVVVMLRNPKDTLVSFYHFYKVNRAFGPFTGTWDDFFEIVKKKQLIYGDWFEHTLAWWKLRNEPNVLILKYEDMKMDPVGNIKELARFMDRELTGRELDTIVQATSFDAMKKNTSVNYTKSEFMTKGSTFMRKGSIGDWKNHFTVAQNAYFDTWYDAEMKGSGLDFTFE